MRTSVGSADVASLQEQNHYERLGLSNDADSVVIKRAYRKACLRFHPDKARAEDREYATECMQMISQAHTILNDPMKRAAYDRWLEYGAAEGTAFNENDDGGIPWSEDGGIVGTLTNVVLLTLLAALFSFMLAQQVYQQSQARVPALWYNVARTFATPLKLKIEQYAVHLPSCTATCGGLFMLWLGGVGEGDGGAVVSIRWLLGCGSVLSMMLSLHGVADPHRDSPIEDQIHWWDTTVTTGLFAHWFWLRGGSLVPSVVWSYLGGLAVSTLVERTLGHDEDVLEAQFRALRHEPLRTLGFVGLGATVVAGVFYLQYAFWTRVGVVVLCGAVSVLSALDMRKPITDDQQERRWLYIQQAVVIGWLFSWHSLGIFWTAAGWLGCLLASTKAVVEQSLRGTVHLGILLGVGWPAAQWIVVGGLDYLLHGSFLDTLWYIAAGVVVYPVASRVLARVFAAIESGMAEEGGEASASSE